MSLEQTISCAVTKALKALYELTVDINSIQIQQTKREFVGDLTIVTFPYSKSAHKSPEQVGEELGAFLVQHNPEIASYNVIKGFLNLSIHTSYWIDQLNTIDQISNFGFAKSGIQRGTMMVEYSSPNTNKPLHLGHIRNNLLGYSISQIQAANGWHVIKTNIVNDRGIHICKSMLAWLRFGKGQTPESSGLKGDHLVGDYYVKFDKAYKEEVASLISQGMSEEDAKRKAPLMQEAQSMLLRWEQNDPDIRKLWATMNQWVYSGFDQTYKMMGVSFDKIYYESDTYLVGKKAVEQGLEKGIFYRRADGSVWANLTGDGLDEKLLLRSDGTSVYMTQDIGTAKLRYADYKIDKMVYVVGNEQNYHFQVLSLLLDKLGFEWGKELVHFSYGMVELPEGKMKSREGTVVDADDLMEEMIQTALDTSKELGKLDGLTTEQVQNNARMIGLGALKYFILKVDPRKNMTFNPKESIDFNGNTGPFIQYAYARIQSVLRKAAEENITIKPATAAITITAKEQYLIQLLNKYPDIVAQAGDEFSPAIIANYIYDLVKEYNQFYHDHSILHEANTELKNFRLLLSKNIGNAIASGMNLLGIEVPERM